MKNIILPLCPLWFIECLTTGKNKKNKNSSCRLKKCFYLCSLLKKQEQFFKVLEFENRIKKNKFRFIFANEKRSFIFALRFKIRKSNFERRIQKKTF